MVTEVKDKRNKGKKRQSDKPVKHICPQGECDLVKKCGGCQYQGMPYGKQLAKKHREVTELLGKFCKVEPVIGMEQPFHYRNKVHVPLQDFVTEALYRVFISRERILW